MITEEQKKAFQNAFESAQKNTNELRKVFDDAIKASGYESKISYDNLMELFNEIKEYIIQLWEKIKQFFLSYKKAITNLTDDNGDYIKKVQNDRNSRKNYKCNLHPAVKGFRA